MTTAYKFYYTQYSRVLDRNICEEVYCSSIEIFYKKMLDWNSENPKNYTFFCNIEQSLKNKQSIPIKHKRTSSYQPKRFCFEKNTGFFFKEF